MFNEDGYRNNQLNKHLEEDNSELSNCCNAEILEDSDVCSECMEHCVTVTEDYENAMCDKADSERELEREADD